MAEFELYVKGKKVPTNAFVAGIFHDVMLALLSHLRDIDLSEIKSIKVE
jgi:hypothetical protein